MTNLQPSAAASTASDPTSWVECHGDYLYSNALLRLGDPDLAAEMVQETFLGALKNRHSFAGHSSERTWLVGILKHKIIDHLRKTSREVEFTVKSPLGWETEEPFHHKGRRRGHWRDREGLAPHQWGSDPTAELERKEFWTVLKGCLEDLPPRLVQAFSLREIDGLSSGEVCKILNIKANNLWVMLYRSRMQLRRCIELKLYTST